MYFSRFVTKLLEELVFFVCVVPNNGQEVLSVVTSTPNRERQKLMREQNILAQVSMSVHTHAERQTFVWPFCPSYLDRMQVDLKFKGICQLFYPFCYFPPSPIPDKKIDTILSTVRAVTRKRQVELAHR